MSQTRELFGKRLRSLRKRRKMTQEKLAEDSDLSVNMIRLMERGKAAASFETLDQLSQALHVPIKEFFDFDSL